ncbi:hypothetical protein C8R46DRAFT_1038265 [Mycena filopes]|nr:hypothetical protein C8R46DRAFT_1038265 [Mycena filopes]
MQITSSSIDKFPLPIELWLKSVFELIHDPTLTPSQSAKNRAAVACVSKVWRGRVYSVSAFWSSITIFKTVSIDRLRFVIAQCRDGDLDLTLNLREIRSIAGRAPTVWTIASLVDAIFDCIGPTSSRWRSFELCTENPFVFKRVQSLCAGLPADRLSRLKLSYVYMPGYSNHIHTPAVYELPFQVHPWFSDSISRLSELRLFCAPMNWNAVGRFEHLEVVELTDFSADVHLDPGLLPALCRGAPSLRVLILGALRPFLVPADFRLESTSLRELDVEFYKPVFVGAILASVVAPGLRELVVRQVYDQLHALLACPDLLSRIERFTAYSSFGDHITIQHLFTAMPRLLHLDLSHSVPSAFNAYCQWAATRVSLGERDHSAHLQSLSVCRVPVEQVVGLVLGLGHSVGELHSPRSLRRVRFERSWDIGNLTRLRELVPDFALIDICANEFMVLLGRDRPKVIARPSSWVRFYQYIAFLAGITSAGALKVVSRFIAAISSVAVCADAPPFKTHGNGPLFCGNRTVERFSDVVIALKPPIVLFGNRRIDHLPDDVDLAPTQPDCAMFCRHPVLGG